MPLFRSLFRLLILIAGALVGLALFLFALLAFTLFVIVSLLRGKKPNVAFRMNQNPWAQRRAPAGAAEDVVDVEVREVKEQQPTLPRH
ncbi:hypothetical protein [Roseateles asaccharophilus]|uniref:Uncharacterized protein n=1 Tax=Roseateles asaccharophilus TaxID=582607 RepID=A0ABU2A6C8_9BURK|nr:hypothetical protein [Roseateles asaccharophilus]MDR7332037.1 hypothetical protein [Roseateles asaccharophilus]